jgi:hypothetical protein
VVLGFPSNAWTGEGWPDLIVWLSPHLFGLEVKQGKAHATPRQLSRLMWLRKHNVHAWIVRSPQDAITVIQGALTGTMTFNADLLAELDAALMGAPAPVETPIVEEDLPVFSDLVAEAQAQLQTPEHQHAVDVAINGVSVQDVYAETDPTLRIADALEALVLELRMLNTNVAALRDASPVQSVAMTVAAPTPRRRRGGIEVTDQAVATD